jgi:hypothetical protein
MKAVFAASFTLLDAVRVGGLTPAAKLVVLFREMLRPAGA